MEKRRIIYVGTGIKPYQILKPRTDREGWHEYGEKKSLEAISFLYASHKFELFMEDAIANRIGLYLKKREAKRREYASKNNLETTAQN